METENAHLIEMCQFLVSEIKKRDEPKVEQVNEDAHFEPLRQRENPRERVFKIRRALNASLRRG